MDDALKTTKTVYPVSQFLDWQRGGTLNLSPIFQRRPVWKRPAKSLLIDSVLRGYPIPIVLLRQVQDLQDLSTKMEVIDGQQRLRALLSYIDPDCLSTSDLGDHSVTILRTHNRRFAGTPFAALPEDVKRMLLGYELSVHIFPATTGDELVFRLFARLNSTGLPLKKQEIRNAEFHGVFKTLVYDLSFENLDRWRRWRVFSDEAMARMDEAEAVSEYLLAMIRGVSGKSQAAISRFYKEHEEEMANTEAIEKRFRATLADLDSATGDMLGTTVFRRAALFYSLFACVYDHMYGLGCPLDGRKPRPLPRGFRRRLEQASDRIGLKDLPEGVQDAMDKATGDKARRDERQQFIMEALGLEPAG